VLCYIQNGDVFVKEFIWKHHISRFSSSDLQHVQPWWFYIPVLLGLLFPWSATVALLPQRVDDNRRKLLLLIVVFGFVFFSAATNKLPGYLLPLLPLIAALAGLRLSEADNPRPYILSSAALLLLLPFVAGTLPLALAQGLSSVPIVAADWWAVVPIIAALAFAILFLRKGRRTYAIATTVMAATFGVTYLKVRMFPVLDQVVSARPQWLLIRNAPDEYCAGDLHRNHRYGLNYYTRTPLPTCESQPGRKPLER
jgi:4-amino-4-deoxy-L-arabinose transferase-like glycosyltransferase